MKLKLFLLLLLTATLPALAQKISVAGTVVDADTGNPIPGAIVTLNEQGITVTAGPGGDFLITDAAAGQATLQAIAFDYNDAVQQLTLTSGQRVNVGAVRMTPLNSSIASSFYEESRDMYFDESVLDDDDSSSQAVAALAGANDNIFYNAASYNFQPTFFNFRGYDRQYTQVYINGFNFNSLGRGDFSYSMLGGMTSRAFRQKTTTIGLGAAAYGFGGIGGSVNFSTLTSGYAPGFNGSLAYTNSNYMFRAMATYSTGISRNGWGVTVSAIGRYSDEGVVPGTWYNSAGVFASVEKEFNPHHSLTLTMFGAPTQRAAQRASVQEAYDLADDNLYNPVWGWQDGKKRSSSIVEQFDPTAMLNWIYKDDKTTLNTGVAARWSHYSKSSFDYNAGGFNPLPDNYKRLPSFFTEEEQAEQYTDLWRNDESFRQINWEEIYNANYLNNYADQAIADPDKRAGASIILGDRVSNLMNYMFNSMIDRRISPVLSLQGGVSLTYTNGSYFKKVRDLLGGGFWRDTDSFTERDFRDDPNMLYNDLDNPNRQVKKGDRYGYDYNIHAIEATAWLQNMITLPKWDINYGLKMSYTQFYRDGNMRNGRAPEDSKGKGDTHRFDNAGVKVGATYKLDGRNFITAHAEYTTRAPRFEYSYVMPEIKDRAIDDLSSERIASADLSYNWNYRRFRGSITGYFTDMSSLTEKYLYYDGDLNTNMIFVLNGVKRRYMGVELGMAYKITSSLTATFAGTMARYQYMNNPNGVQCYQNGVLDDINRQVYIKNFRIGGTPQTAFNLGLDYAAPENWFFGINGSWMGNSYVKMNPARHIQMPELWTLYPNPEDAEQFLSQMGHQEKLKDAFVLNLSIGKAIYLHNGMALNFNLTANNILCNRNVVANAYEQGRFDYTNYRSDKFANRYMYGQGLRVFINAGIRF